MFMKTDTPREIYMDVAEDQTITEQQQQELRKGPIENTEAQLEDDVSSHALEDSLSDAVDGVEVDMDLSG